MEDIEELLLDKDPEKLKNFLGDGSMSDFWELVRLLDYYSQVWV